MLIDWLRLLRVGTLFSPAADVVAGTCLAGAPTDGTTARAALASVFVYAAGMVLNDHADRVEDARNRPERPIPKGAISPFAALALGLSLLAGGVALSPWWPWHAGLALGVLVYDYVLKKRAWLAALGMGTLRAGNLLAGAAVVAQAVPEEPLIVGIALGYGAYIAAVTVLGSYEDDERVARNAVVAIQTVPTLIFLIVTLVLPERWPALGFGLAAVVWFSRRSQRKDIEWTRAEIRKSMRYLLLGTMLLMALICVGCDRNVEGIAIAAVIPIAAAISKKIALT